MKSLTISRRLFFLFFIFEVLHFAAVRCQCKFDITVGATSGSIRYPESGEYGTEVTCTWLLKASEDNARILYQLQDVAIDCSDKVEIFDGENEAANRVSSDCTSNSLFSKSIAVSSGKNLFIRFTSDSTAAPGKDLGFTLSYVSTVGGGCPSDEQVQIGSKETILTSPSFPDKYQNSMTCTWTLKPETDGSTLKGKVTFLDVERDSKTGHCFDALKIKSDSGETSELCGNEQFSPTQEFEGQEIKVEFKSDNQQTERGFVMVVQATGGDSTSTGTDTGGDSTSTGTGTGGDSTSTGTDTGGDSTSTGTDTGGDSTPTGTNTRTSTGGGDDNTSGASTGTETGNSTEDGDDEDDDNEDLRNIVTVSVVAIVTLLYGFIFTF